MSTLRLTADGSLQRYADGRVLVGGSPLRVLRLSERGARLAGAWLDDGEPVGSGAAQRGLAARLVRTGMAHPRYDEAPFSAADVTVVVPVRDRAEGLERLRTALGKVDSVIVVDDGSAVPVPGAAVRHPVSRGPAAARNAGWRLAKTPLVAFVDADVLPASDWLDPILAHFADPAVALVAPRVLSTPGDSALARYEEHKSPIDLGPEQGLVRPGSRVSYVPSAALVVRADALREHGGFDERLRFGEDVDLVWRLAAAGALVRYEPASTAFHAPRSDWIGWVRQRFGYGSSAAPLALRHPRAGAPVRVSRWTALAWGALAAGRPVAGLAVAGGTAALLPRKLRPFDVPDREALRLALLGHLGAGRLFADAVTRSWWPVAVPALALNRRGRLLLAAAYARHLRDWRRERPPLDPVRWTAARIADDLAYGAGVWWGSWRHRTVAALLPDLSDWPGRDGAQQEAADRNSAEGGAR